MNDEKSVEIKYDEPQYGEAAPTTRLEEILGNFRMVTTIPTWTPKTFKDGIALDSSLAKFYYYDFTNNLWRNTGSVSYGGAVGSAGTGNTLPTGWSASYNAGTKIYTVTHNLGSTAYSYVAMPLNTYGLYPNTQSLAANTFTIEFDNSSGTAFPTNWQFVLTLII